jgi:hypothetical protein
MLMEESRQIIIYKMNMSIRPRRRGLMDIFIL